MGSSIQDTVLSTACKTWLKLVGKMLKMLAGTGSRWSCSQAASLSTSTPITLPLLARAAATSASPRAEQLPEHALCPHCIIHSTFTVSTGCLAASEVLRVEQRAELGHVHVLVLGEGGLADALGQLAEGIEDPEQLEEADIHGAAAQLGLHALGQQPGELQLVHRGVALQALSRHTHEHVSLQ